MMVMKMMNIKKEIIQILEDKENMAAWEEEEYRIFDELKEEYKNLDDERLEKFKEEIEKEVEETFNNIITDRNLNEEELTEEIKEEIKGIIRNYLIELSVINDFNDLYGKEFFYTDSLAENLHSAIDECLRNNGYQI